MSFTQQSVLFLLVGEGGKVKKSDLEERFKGSMESADPAEKERNRELFKTIVNNVAFVKQIDGVRYVILKKMYQHLLLDGVQSAEKADNEEIPATGEQQRPPARSEQTESCDQAGGERPAGPGPDHEQASGGNPAPLLSPLQLALQRSKSTDVRVKRMLHFEIQKQEVTEPARVQRKPFALPLRVPPSVEIQKQEVTEPARVQSKPFALPLRVPPSVEIRKLKDPDDVPVSPAAETFSNKQRPSAAETWGRVSSPQPRRAAKTAKASEEPKDTRVPSSVPLEQSEHEWIVKCAAGHWSQVYGLLLRDNQLAEKKDFMSGFTALHWAAKCGNSKMLVTIIDLAKRGGVDVDVDAKAHGGYTPLHIAALHDQEYIMAMLVGEYGANPGIRDHCGKRPYHYLHKGVSGTVREMLGEPKGQRARDRTRTAQEKEEQDLFPDISRSLHSISRLFNPHAAGHRRKHKQRAGLAPPGDDNGEEREDGLA